MNHDPDSPDAEWIRNSFTAWQPALLRYAYSLCRDHERAQDAVQETFLRFVKTPKAQIEFHLAPWLFRVCRSRIIDERRKEGRMSALNEVDFQTKSADGPSPQRQAESGELCAVLLQCVEMLPPAQREVVRLKYQNGLSYEEIAHITSRTVTAVGVLLHEAVKNLRHKMRQAKAV